MKIKLTYHRSTEIEYYLTKIKGLSPLIVYLHGAGERNEPLGMLEYIPRYIKSAIKDKINKDVAVLYPKCEDNQIWNPHELAELIKNIAESNDIISNQIYVAGFSMGGRGVWDVITEYPNLFAAAVPVSGYSCYLKAFYARNMPTMAFHGRSDSIVPLNESVKMINEMRCCGNNQAKLMTHDGGHVDAFLSYFIYNETELKWLFSKVNKNDKF